MSDPYTPEELAAAAEQLRAGTPAAPPSEQDIAAKLAMQQSAAPAGMTEVNVAQLLAGIKLLQDRVDALEAEKASGAAVPVTDAANALRDLIATHAAHTPGTDHSDLLRLADDAADAAKNAAESGDGSLVTQISGKISRALNRVHPGPGTHHWFTQALGFADVHLPDAAAQLVPKPAQAPAGSIGTSGASVPVVQGSVTG